MHSGVNSNSDHWVGKDDRKKQSSSVLEMKEETPTENDSDEAHQRSKRRKLMTNTDPSGSCFIPIKWTEEINSTKVLRIDNMSRSQIENCLEDDTFLSLLEFPSQNSAPKVVIMKKYTPRMEGYFLVSHEFLPMMYESCAADSVLYLAKGKLKLLRSQLLMDGLIMAKMAPKLNRYMTPKEHVSEEWFEDGHGRPGFPDRVVLDLGEMTTEETPLTRNRPFMVPVNPIFHSIFSDWQPPEDRLYKLHYFDVHHIQTNATAMISVQCSTSLKNISVKIDSSMSGFELRNATSKQHSQVFVMVGKKGCDAKLYSVPEMLSRCVCDLDYQYLESEDLRSFLCKIGVKSGNQVIVCTGKLSVAVERTTDNNCYLGPAYYKKRCYTEQANSLIENANTEKYITDLNELHSLPSSGFESSPFSHSWCEKNDEIPPLSLPCYSLTCERGERNAPCKLELTLRPVVLLDIPENFAKSADNQSTENIFGNLKVEGGALADSACTWCAPEYLVRYHEPGFNLGMKQQDFGLNKPQPRDLRYCFCDFHIPLEKPYVQKVRHCRENHSKLLLRGYIKCDLCPQYFGSRSMLAGHRNHHDGSVKARRGNRKYWDYGRNQLRKDLTSFFKENEFTTDLIVTSCEDWVLTNTYDESPDSRGGGADAGITAIPESIENGETSSSDPGESIPSSENIVSTTEINLSDPRFLNPSLERVEAAEAWVDDDIQNASECRICGRGQQGDDHTKECHGNVVLPCPWKCKTCGRQFAAVDAFMVHLPCVGGDLPCAACSYKTLNKGYTIAKHYEYIHSDQSISCMIHVGKRDPDRTSFWCDYCPRSFYNEADMDEHLVVHEVSLNGRPLKNEDYTCKDCEFAYTNEKSRDVHQLFHDCLDCSYCEQRFKDVDSLQKHIPSCHVLPDVADLNHRCCHCGVSKRGSFLTQTPLERGCEYKHVLNKQCSVCNKNFKYQTLLAKHLYEAHRDSRKTYCQKCDVWFPTRYLLMVHRKTRCLRVEKRLYSCSCGVNFSTRIKWKSHQRKKVASRHLQKMRTNNLKKGINRPNQDSQAGSTCSKCYKLFPKRHQLHLHMRLAHRTSETNCSVCRHTFSSAKMKRNHDRVYHGELLFRCSVCQFRVRSRSGLQRHMTDMHYQYYKCIVCQIAFEFQHQYEQHMKLHENQCEKCFGPHGVEESCQDRSVRRAMELSNTPYEKWKRPLTSTKFKFECIVCMQTFGSRTLLGSYESHWNQHAMEVSAITKCPHCCYTTVHGFGDIRRHMIEFHPKCFHQCATCLLHFTHAETLEFHKKYCKLTSVQQKTFIKLSKVETFCHKCVILLEDRFALSRHHAEVHQQLKQGPYYCHVCDIGFKRQRQVTRHNIHHQKFVCELCPFTSGGCPAMEDHLLKLHKLARRQEVTYHCDDCKFTAKRKTTLEKHLIRKHRHTLAEDCQFLRICDKCGKGLHSEEMYNHTHSHLQTDERKYVCEVCSARFKMKHHLANHMNTHQDKQFACKECKLKFTLRHHLEAHQRSFHGRSGYKCRDCGEEFKLRWKRTKHRQTEHEASGFTDDEDLGLGLLGKTPVIDKTSKHKKRVFQAI